MATARVAVPAPVPNPAMPAEGEQAPPPVGPPGDLGDRRRKSSGRSHKRSTSGYVGDVNVHVAAYEGNMEQLQRYVALGGNLEKVDSYEATALLLAAEKGHVDAVRFLLDSGASLAARDEHSYTALHLAAYYGRLNVAELLLQRGAEVSVVDDRGRTPRKLASRKEISKLLAAKEREAMLGVDVFTATERNDVEMVRKYVASRGNLDLKGRSGMTALHVACFNGYSEIARLLLEGGADTSAVDEDQDTPLHYACSNGQTDIISMLLTKGADPTALDGMGRTPGQRNNRPQIQKLLEEESYKSIPKNLAKLRTVTVDLQKRVDSNESLFVQKAIAIKGLRLALEEKDAEIRILKKKILQQDGELKQIKAKIVVADDLFKAIAAAGSGEGQVEAAIAGVVRRSQRGGECTIS
ncbi:unnamed protein product [Phaeothamnion confervicola]